MIKNNDTKKDKGIVFIVEGNAERLFYEKFIEFACGQHDIFYEKTEWNHNSKITDNLIITTFNKVKTAVYIQDCTSGSQLPLQKENILNIIHEYFSIKENFGVVFICFDDETNKTRPYDEEDIDAMISDLKNVGINCTKIKANNTIEDFMFNSFEEILNYLNLPLTTNLSSIPGKTGKSKMERLFDMANKKYKGAGSVNGLVNILDMKKILQNESQLQQIINLLKSNHEIV